MRAWVTVRYLLDLLAEQVAIRSGILLNDYDIKAIIENSSMKEFASIFARDPNATFGVRPEFVEDLLLIIRSAIGNLTNTQNGMSIFFRRLGELQESGYDVVKFIPALEHVMKQNKKIIGESEIIEISALSELPIAVVIDIVRGLGEVQNRGLSFWEKFDRKIWDGVTPLSDLFNKEITIKDGSVLIDQKFLDYLAVNSKKVDKIHWRNFERICAEFFSRNGYYVKLGPGVADGGVDIRVWPENEDSNGPPLMLIQCKRYKEGNMVDIGCVKAFWTDVQDENAKKGIIVTTSQIAPGGHKVCEARKWTLDLVEGEKVKEWLKSMWRFQWQEESQNQYIGRYLLPPAIPLSRPIR